MSKPLHASQHRSSTDLKLQAFDAQSAQVAAILVTIANWLDGHELEKPLHVEIEEWSNKCGNGCKIKDAVRAFADSLEVPPNG